MRRGKEAQRGRDCTVWLLVPVGCVCVRAGVGCFHDQENDVLSLRNGCPHSAVESLVSVNAVSSASVVFVEARKLGSRQSKNR